MKTPVTAETKKAKNWDWRVFVSSMAANSLAMAVSLEHLKTHKKATVFFCPNILTSADKLSTLVYFQDFQVLMGRQKTDKTPRFLNCP